MRGAAPRWARVSCGRGTPAPATAPPWTPPAPRPSTRAAWPAGGTVLHCHCTEMHCTALYCIVLCCTVGGTATTMARLTREVTRIFSCLCSYSGFSNQCLMSGSRKPSSPSSARSGDSSKGSVSPSPTSLEGISRGNLVGFRTPVSLATPAPHFLFWNGKQWTVSNKVTDKYYAVLSHYCKEIFCENSNVGGFLWSS